MATDHDPADAIGTVTHYFSHLSVAAVEIHQPIRAGERIHIKGHTTDIVQTADSMQVEHADVDQAAPGDDVALHVNDHVREHDKIYREPADTA